MSSISSSYYSPAQLRAIRDADTMGDEPTVQGKEFVDAKDAFATLQKAKSQA